MLVEMTPIHFFPNEGTTDVLFDHRVQFYEHDSSLYSALEEFFTAGQRAGEPMVMFATAIHRKGFASYLQARGFDLAAVHESEQLILIDAGLTLAEFMAQGRPDPCLFRGYISNTFEALRFQSQNGRIRVFAEMVDLLWKEGNPQATIELEGLWIELSQIFSFSLLCGYFANPTEREKPCQGSPSSLAYDTLCSLHLAASQPEVLLETGITAPLPGLDELLILRRREQELEKIIKHHQRLEQSLREALADHLRTEDTLRANHQELEDFLNNAAEGFHWVDASGVILGINRSFKELLGYAKEEYIGRNIAEFYADREVIEGMLKRLRQNESIEGSEARLRSKNGSMKHVLVNSNAIVQDGHLVRAYFSVRDITRRKRLEDELLSQNQDLSRAVRFSEMFVGILGHDLRNPLSAITTAASLIQRRGDSEKIVKPATRILNSARRMGRMIDQVLDFARIRLGMGISIEPRRTDLAEICQLAMDEFKSTAPLCKYALFVTGDPIGCWDRDRIMQLVANLLGNAFTHGDATGQVTVHIDGTNPLFIGLDIHNTGMVPVEIMPVLFEPYRSATNQKNERSNGLGLGLFISQQIAVAHEGTIHVTSTLVDGTHLVVRLPRAPRDPKSDTPSQTSTLVPS